MKGWVLTTVTMQSPDRYTDEIIPITAPLMAAYAARWEMDFDHQIITPEEYAPFDNLGTAPRGTACTYASIPHRRHLLDEYEGVVFFDSDTVVMSDQLDICTEVTPEQPIGTEPGCNAATMVLLSCDRTRHMLDLIWDTRHGFKHYQWLEQAAYMELMGFDPEYPGDNQPPVWHAPTEWTPLRADLDPGWNAHPEWLHVLGDRPLRSLHPGGVQPYERRLAMVQEYAAASQLRDTVSTTN